LNNFFQTITNKNAIKRVKAEPQLKALRA